MQISNVFLDLGEERFSQLVRSISIGKLRTYQLYERMKARMHLAKINTENLRKAAPRFWQRISEHDAEFASDLSQAILISHMDLIVDVLNLLGIPHEDGFFSKDMDATPYLTDGWQRRVFDQFAAKYPEAVLLFYINHLALDLGKAELTWQPQPAL
jgi:hypothetical protein